MRRMLALLLILCVVFSLCGCNQQTSGEPVHDLAKKEAEIRKAWGDMGTWYDYNDPATYNSEWRYYGEFEDYDVILRIGQMDLITVKTIAGQNIILGSSFNLYGYKNGDFHDVEELFRKGKLSVESICNIAVAHMQTMEEIHGGEYVEAMYAGYEKPE